MRNRLLAIPGALIALCFARSAQAESEPECRPSIVADRPGAATAPAVVLRGCAQLAFGTELALASSYTEVTPSGLLRYGVLPRVEVRAGLQPATLSWLDGGDEEIRGPLVGGGAKLQLLDGKLAFGLLAEGAVQVTDPIDESSAALRLLVEAVVEETTLAVNLGPDLVPSADGHASAATWVIGVSRPLLGDRLGHDRADLEHRAGRRGDRRRPAATRGTRGATPSGSGHASVNVAGLRCRGTVARTAAMELIRGRSAGRCRRCRRRSRRRRC